MSANEYVTINGVRYAAVALTGATDSAGNPAGNVVDGYAKWKPASGVTEKPVWYSDIAVAISAATVTTHTLTGANATAVEVYCNGDASFEGVEIVLNAANTTDAWAEIGAASGTASLAYYCPKDKTIFLPLATVEDSTLSLTTVSLGAVGSAVNDIRLRFA